MLETRPNEKKKEKRRKEGKKQNGRTANYYNAQTRLLREKKNYFDLFI